MVFSHIHSTDSLNDTLLSQGHFSILEVASSVGRVSGICITRTGKGVKGLGMPGYNLQVNCQSHPFDKLNNLVNMFPLKYSSDEKTFKNK